MKKRVKLAAVLSFLLFVCCSLTPTQQAGKNAYVFSLQDTGGNTVSLSDFKGKGVILFFWTTWCPHCRSQLKEFNREYDAIRDSGIELISINVGESRSVVERYRSKYSLVYPVLLDYNRRTSSNYGVIGVPTIILVSEDGRIVKSAHYLPSNYIEYFL